MECNDGMGGSWTNAVYSNDLYVYGGGVIIEPAPEEPVMIPEEPEIIGEEPVVPVVVGEEPDMTKNCQAW